MPNERTVFCYSRLWGASNLVYLVCPGCGETHSHKVPAKEDLSPSTIGKNLGYFKADCADDANKRRKVRGYWLVFDGVERNIF